MKTADLKVNMEVTVEWIPCIVREISDGVIKFEITERDMVNDVGDIMELEVEFLDSDECRISTKQFEAAQEFMQECDAGGTWLEARFSDAAFILDTMEDMISYGDMDAEEAAPHIEYLKGLVK